jgi:hypothetical protein
MTTDSTRRQWAEDAAQRLESVPGFDYYASEIPTATDRHIAEIVGDVLADPAHQAPVLLPHLSADRRHGNIAQALWIFGPRAAALARRTGAPRYLDLAVIAIGLSFTGDGDFRNGVSALSVPWHAAQSLGVDPDPIYRRIAAMPIGEGNKWVQEFVERRPEDQTLEVMRYRETSDASGVRYERIMSEVSPETLAFVRDVLKAKDQG